MKSATVAFGLFAGLASASYNHHPRHFHNPYWRRNETGAAAGPSTTLTVAITTTHTITSCAPTITNCPANAGNSTGPAVVTEIIDLTTTVCPVTAAESISSSMIGAHSSGLIPGSTRTVTTTLPSSTGANSPAGSSAPGVSTSAVVVGTVDQTHTLTVGPSSSQSILVTTVKSYLTSMVTVTAVPVASAGSNSGSGSGSGNGEGAGSYPVAEATSEGTTTTTMTSTGTRTVTVAPAKTSGEVGVEATSGAGNGSGSGEGECVASTVTVTETIPATTVYITAPAAQPTGAKAVASNAGTDASATSSTPSTGGNDSGNGSSDEGDDCPEESDVAVTATATQTVSPVPYPTGNGTVPSYPSGAAIPTVILRH
ncbi:hypothetical protein F4819DRAFT_451022 [Hypoxylon fuscum]|nr:hypothetical protein F4819DRAFT_451022 [Hypoxylon fuscum]